MEIDRRGLFIAAQCWHDDAYEWAGYFDADVYDEEMLLTEWNDLTDMYWNI